MRAIVLVGRCAASIVASIVLFVGTAHWRERRVAARAAITLGKVLKSSARAQRGLALELRIADRSPVDGVELRDDVQAVRFVLRKGARKLAVQPVHLRDGFRRNFAGPFEGNDAFVQRRKRWRSRCG